MILGPGLARLRRALANQELGRADELWSELLRTVQPLGAKGRQQLADCFEAFASLKEALGKPVEAERFRRRAATARKDPSELQRHGSGDAANPGWDNHAWVRLQAGELSQAAEDAIQKVHVELEIAETRGYRRALLLALGFGALVGLWVGALTRLPMAVLALLGAVVGIFWARKKFR
jgi:hypothetical protein